MKKKAAQLGRRTLNSDPPVLPDVATGKPEAIAACLDRYGGLVWSLARRNCPDEQTAEDAVQDIFVKIWQVADRFDANLASEATFIAMIARRRLIDLYRKRKPERAVAIDSETLDRQQDSQRDAASRAELNDDARQAENFLRELPQQQQHVIRLSVYDGLSHSRIAEATGLALGTVKTHIRRGLGELQRRLFAAGARDASLPTDGGA
ncbi:RNA polymerase sigma factor [Mariniblastus fucicola]|uniref:RNA polymerase sigma factor n=1 Tax=Mariniblastus fucicola TaxID=980251 RepID=UPI001EE4C28A|nr:sigma-70 family RNA polymerase sigma factor [Mariniblastus fucicola]